jgi:Bifunctional DNA primase/polymerase, N-terminal
MIPGAAGPLKFTRMRWLNRRMGEGPKCAKIPVMHAGFTYAAAFPYGFTYAAAFPYGSDTEAQWSPWKATDGPVQTGLVTSATSGLIVIDVDHPDEYAATETAKHLGREHAMSTRGDHYHIGLDCRGIPRDQWPKQGPIPGADIKCNGFVAAPGSVHWTGALYEACLLADGSLRVVVATEEIIAAMVADRASHNGTGHGGADGGGHDGEIAAAVLRWVRAGLTADACYRRCSGRAMCCPVAPTCRRSCS